jgi:hypothetical protein
MRRIVIAVTVLGVLAVATGLACSVSQPAAVADASSLLLNDQSADDGHDRVPFLMPVLGIAVLVQRSRRGCPLPQAAWPAGCCAVSDHARAPPLRQCGEGFEASSFQSIST